MSKIQLSWNAFRNNYTLAQTIVHELFHYVDLKLNAMYFYNTYGENLFHGIMEYRAYNFALNTGGMCQLSGFINTIIMRNINNLITFFFFCGLLSAQENLITLTIKNKKAVIGNSVILEIRNNTNESRVLYIDSNQISVDLIEKEKNNVDTTYYRDKIYLERNILSLSLRIRNSIDKEIVEYKHISVAVSPHMDINEKDKFIIYLKNYLESIKIELRPKERLEILINVKYDNKYKAIYELKNRKYWLNLVYNGNFIKYVCDKYSDLNSICDSKTIYENIESNKIKFCID